MTGGALVASIPTPGALIASIPTPGALIASIPTPGTLAASIPTPGALVASMPMPGTHSPATGGMSGLMWMPQHPPTPALMMDVHLQPVPVLPALALALLAGYLLGVWRLKRRGAHWSIGRTLWWMLGVASILAVTATGVDGYGMELFSVHMVQHMVLSMLTPVFLVLGAPITLTLRALPATAGRRGLPRRLFLRILHSRVATWLTHPTLTLLLFLLSLYGLYFTPAFDYLMSTMWGHNLMLIHFVLVSWLYFWSILGVDPTPRRVRGIRSTLSAPIIRLFELFVTVPFHAFFGIVVMMSADLIVRYYAMPIPGWGVSPLADQRKGGGIAWIFTELPTAVVIGVFVYQWMRLAERHQQTADRRADRDGDADLNAYNAYLTTLAARDRASTP